MLLFYKDCLTNDKTQFSFVASNLYAAFLPHDFVKYFIFSDKLSLHCCTKKNGEKLHSKNVSRCFYIEKHISDIYLNWRYVVQKVSLFGVILVRIFPAFSRIRSVFSPNARKCGKNADQNKSEYGHFLRSDIFKKLC